MQIRKFQQSTSSSLSSAYTTANLRPNPIQRSVRRERFIPEETASDVANLGLAKARATETIFGAVSATADAFAKKIEDAEFKSQSAKAVGEYQTHMAKMRAEQMAQPVTSTDEEGNRKILSDDFSNQYSDTSTKVSEAIYNGGLTNERAKEYFQQQKNRIDAKHLDDIYKGNLDSRIQVAKSDSLKALEVAGSKGGIHSIVNNMAETGLIKYEEAPALAKKHIQGLNFRRSMTSLHLVSNASSDTNISDATFFDRVATEVDSATELLINGDIDQRQYSTINANAKKVEDQRRVLVEQQQGLNMLNVSAKMLEAQANGESLDGFIDMATSTHLAKTVGVDNAMALQKSVKSIVQSGAVEIGAKQDANATIRAFTDGTMTYADAQATLNNDAQSLGAYYMTASEKLGQARLNQHNKKRGQANGIVDTLVYSKFSAIDEQTGNASKEALAAKKQWNTRLDFYLDSNPEGDPRKYVINQFVNEISMPEYLGDTPLLKADISKAREYIADVKNTILDSDSDKFYEARVTSDGRTVSNVSAWYRAETQILDELSSLQKLMRDPALQSLIDNKALIGIDDE